MFRKIEYLAGGLERLMGIFVLLGCILLVVMMILTTADVFLRYAFRAPIPGNMYYCMFIQVAVVFLGMGYVQAKRRHINVHLIFAFLPQKLHTFFQLFGDLMMTVVAVLFIWQGSKAAVEAWEMGEKVLAGGIDK